MKWKRNLKTRERRLEKEVSDTDKTKREKDKDLRHFSNSITLSLPRVLSLKLRTNLKFRFAKFSVYSLVFVSIEKIYQTLEIVFHHISKHLEFHQKYSAARHIFNSLLSVWKSDETLSRVWYITSSSFGWTWTHEYCISLTVFVLTSLQLTFVPTFEP